MGVAHPAAHGPDAQDIARAACEVFIAKGYRRALMTDVAERLVDRIGIIQGGELRAEGSLDELRTQSGRQGSSLEEVFLHLVAGNDAVPV